MGSRGLRKDEGVGLVVALALHAAVLWAILYLKPGEGDVVKPPQRIEVTISEEVGMTSTSPNPNAQAAPDKSPEIGDPAPEAAPVAPVEPAPAPQPEPRPAPEPAPRAVERPQPKPQPPRPAPRPAPKAPPKPVQKPAPKPVQKPAPKLAPKPAPKQAEKAPPKKPATSTTRKSSAIDDIVKTKPKAPPGKTAGTSKSSTPPKKSGSSAFDDAFKTGTPGATSESGTGKPASAYSQTERASYAQALLRQVKPKWQGRVPEGVGTEKLVTILSVELNRDGSLARRPTVVRQEGIDDSNRAQAARHAEEAVRAVELAAPFTLPSDSFEGWRKLPPLRFKKAL